MDGAPLRAAFLLLHVDDRLTIAEIAATPSNAKAAADYGCPKGTTLGDEGRQQSSKASSLAGRSHGPASRDDGSIRLAPRAAQPALVRDLGHETPLLVVG